MDEILCFCVFVCVCVCVFFFLQHFLGIQTKLNFLGILTTVVSPQTNDQDCISTNKKPQTNDQHLIDGLQRQIQQCCDQVHLNG